jgi:hypothetical protein
LVLSERRDVRDEPGGLVGRLRDGEEKHYDPLPLFPTRRWHHGLFRRRGERSNELTSLETIRSIAVVTLLLAAAVFLMMRGMATWR